MALTLIDLRVEIREEAGLPEQVEISDPRIDQKIADALVEVSRWIPARSVQTLPTVVDTQDYVLPATVLWVREVYFERGLTITILDSSFPPTYPARAGEFTSNQFFEHPSLWEIVLQKMSAYRKTIDKDWIFAPITRTLRLFPTPSKAETLPYAADTVWTVATLPEVLREPLVLYATAKTLDQVALYRARRAGIARSGGRVDYSGGSILLATAQAKREQFEERVQGLSKRFAGKER